jgi:hypothetical protein
MTTAGPASLSNWKPGEHTRAVPAAAGVTDIDQLIDEGAAVQA